VFSFLTLVQGLGLAYAAGLNLYATVAVTGLAIRYGWVHNVPTTIEPFGQLAVIVVAALLYIIEFVATLVPGVASAWETLHSLIRPPAAAVLAAATAWHADPVIVLVAALLGGGLAITTHTTKLGLRYAIDSSPEPVTNGVANLAELGLVSAVAIAIWDHPVVTLVAALIVLVTHEWNWWTGYATLQKTDDAYLQSSTTPLAAKVPGYVRRVLVQDYQTVKAGDALVELVDDD